MNVSIVVTTNRHNFNYNNEIDPVGQWFSHSTEKSIFTVETLVRHWIKTTNMHTPKRIHLFRTTVNRNVLFYFFFNLWCSISPNNWPLCIKIYKKKKCPFEHKIVCLQRADAVFSRFISMNCDASTKTNAIFVGYSKSGGLKLPPKNNRPYDCSLHGWQANIKWSPSTGKI